MVRARGQCVLLSMVLVGIGGCGAGDPLERSGLVLAPPPAWRPAELSTRMVPGTAIATWAGPAGSSLTVFRALPVPGGSAEMIAASLANRLQNLPGVQVVVQRTEAVAGTTAARVEVVGPGTGDAMAPSGTGTPIAPAGKTLVPTRQVTLGFVRPDETLYLAWFMPESVHERLTAEIDVILKSLRFKTSGKLATYRY